MDFATTQEHDLIREAAAKFGRQEVSPTIRERDERGEFDPALLRKMGEAGFLGMSIPGRYGGQDTDYVSLGIVCEELERADTSARVILSVHVGLNSLTLLQWGTTEQKERFLTPQATGEKIAGFGLTEPNAGSDVAGMQTTAVRSGDEYILNGEKAWISLADIADNFLVVAYTDKSAGHRGMSAFIVERTFPGFSSSTIHGKLGVRAGNTGSFVMQDCRVPIANRLGEEGEGFKIAMSALDNGRYTVASGATGLIQACLDASVGYANSRKTFGVPIGKHQLVQQMISQMSSECDISRLLYYRVGWMKNAGIRHTREVSLAKWFACDAAFRAANNAVEIHGAYGFSNEFPAERYFRNSRGAVIYEGTREVHTLMQAEYALGYREDRPLRKTLPPYPFPDDV